MNLVSSADPLVHPATAGPISEFSRSWSLNCCIYNCKIVNYFFLLVRFSSPFMIWDWKRVVRVPNRGSARFLNLIIHYVNGEIFGTEKKWSVFRDGPLCEAVRYRVSTVLTWPRCEHRSFCRWGVLWFKNAFFAVVSRIQII